jgi:arylsulfatase A-like enzyme/Tfp pilus assembly protein PilF
MRGARTRIAAFVAATALAAALACGRAGAPALPIAAGALRGANVILVTIDTLRADHVGAYGSALGLTPTLDRFAGEGLRFSTAYAHVPLTLPSHTTLHTGLYPTTNGVHDNGSRLATKPTLAGVLKAAGYRTGAFVGSFVLDARFGLNAGFDTYDDRMLGSSADLNVVERAAEQVLAPASKWITAPRPETPARSPWFAWVHLYDPHEPYAPPEPYRSRYAGDLYSGEIAYADAALGRFFDRLRAAGALDRTLVVIASDHGESLGEHGERTHGLFAYDATLRVPLIVWAPTALHPAIVAGTARLVDVMPTVLDLVGVPPPAVDGRSLRMMATGTGVGDEPESYFEALNANLTRGWAPLRGVVRHQVKLIDLPIPELYDLAADPGENRNLYASQRERARDLESRLDRLNAASSAAPTRTPVDADAEARLRSLGYIVGTSARPAHAYTAADDPKRLVHLNAALDDAAAMWARGDGERAIATLRGVIAERPDLTVAYERIAFMLRAMGRAGDAVTVLDAAAKAGHADRSLLRSLGAMLRDAGDPARSAAVLEPLVHDDPSDLQAADALGQTYARMNRQADAQTMFRLVLAGSPNAAATWNNLGASYLMEGKLDDAIGALTRATELNADLPAAHNGLGVAYAKRGEIDRAVTEWRRALEISPGYPDALSNLQRAGR